MLEYSTYHVAPQPALEWSFSSCARSDGPPGPASRPASSPRARARVRVSARRARIPSRAEGLWRAGTQERTSQTEPMKYYDLPFKKVQLYSSNTLVVT